jgi:acetyltransferase
MAGEDAIYNAAFKRSDIVRVDAPSPLHLAIAPYPEA